jgi:uncharacterized protein YjbI with pentapeptide repeats
MKKQMKHIKPYIPYITFLTFAIAGFILFRYTGLIRAEDSRDNNSRTPVLCPNCNLNFIHDRLKDKNLNNAYMPNTSFGSTDGGVADLRGVDFNNAYLDNGQFYANLSNVSFKNAYLVGATIDVSSAPSNKVNFRGANLTGTNIIGNFPKADFSQANLTDANLSGVKDMSTANVSETKWSNTICPDGSNSNNSGNSCAGHF